MDMSNAADSGIRSDAPESRRKATLAGRRSMLRTALGITQFRVGAVIFGLVLLVVFLGPLVAPYSHTEYVAIPYQGPSSEAWLGTDAMGRDVLSRVLSGGFSVLWMSFLAGTLGVAAGAAFGLTAGYFGGRVDAVMMRSLDVILAFPQLVLLLLVVSMVGPNPWLIVVLVAIAWIPPVARICRGITTTIVNREYIEAAEVLGYSRRSIVIGEILPNLATPLLVEYGLRISWSIAVIASASFLGLGVQPPSSNWGLMANENREGLLIQPWSVVLPVLMIALLTIGANLVADSFGRAVSGEVPNRGKRIR